MQRDFQAATHLPSIANAKEDSRRRVVKSALCSVLFARAASASRFELGSRPSVMTFRFLACETHVILKHDAMGHFHTSTAETAALPIGWRCMDCPTPPETLHEM